MTQDDSGQPFRLHMTELLRKLQAAGWIKHFEDFDPDSDEPLQIEWNDQKAPMGGKTNFFAFASMLRELAPEKTLSNDEQAMVLLLFQMLFEES
jgi:hypothetical protein